MDLMTSIEQTAGILCREELEFETRGDGRGYRLRFARDMVFVTFDVWQETQVLVTLSSPVLQHIEEDGVGAAVVLNRLHELNHEYRFVKFVFVDGTLLAVYDLLGDAVRAPALLNAVYTVARAANAVGDELEEESGGQRFPYDEACDEEDDEFDFDVDDVDLGEE